MHKKTTHAKGGKFRNGTRVTGPGQAKCIAKKRKTNMKWRVHIINLLSPTIKLVAELTSWGGSGGGGMGETRKLPWK